LRFLFVLFVGAAAAAEPTGFSDEEKRAILAHGPWPVPATTDATNAASGQRAAIELGQRVFFDTRLSGDGRFSCGTCHVPERNWTASRRPRSSATRPPS